MIVRKVLVVFTHPALEKSRVNRALIERAAAIDGVTFHDLYELYPEMDIDVKAEQEMLREHDVILFQYPFFLFSVPALLKEWMDLVLVHGWAFGRNGNALKGKWVCHVITTGGSKASYSKEGYNRFTMRELLAPFEQTASLCGMHYLPPYVIHGTNVMTKEGIEEHAKHYQAMLRLLADQAFDPDGLGGMDNLIDQFRKG
ncbi:MAG: NAD(P)H-dependent oxidoreductase [Chlorobiales bacterium]|nr:NAD(P)H-dependent oxidoreductase [Chlorobiales bacterium]